MKQFDLSTGSRGSYSQEPGAALKDDGTISEVSTSKFSSNTVPNTTPVSPQRRKTVWYELKGDLIGSVNAGIPRCVHYQYYTAGMPARDLHFSFTLKRKTPVRPNLSRMSLTQTTIFVPLNAVLEGAYKWDTQHSDNFSPPLTNMPSVIVSLKAYNGYTDTLAPTTDTAKKKVTNNSVLDVVLNSQMATEDPATGLAVVNVTIPRGIKLAYSYCLRPKNDIAGYIHYRDNVPVAAEVSSYQDPANSENQYRRSTQRLSYTNSYRTQQQVGGSSLDPTGNQAVHTNWQLMRANLLRQADNQEKSPAEILTQYYGTLAPRETFPYVIGQRTDNLDDIAVAQASTTSESVLGSDGAVATFVIDQPIMDGFYSHVSGWIYTFFEVQTEPSIPCHRDRESFLTARSDFYHPDLLTVKDDVFYKEEFLPVSVSLDGSPQPVYFHRKYSEMARLPSTYIGDVVVTTTNVPTVSLVPNELQLWITHPNPRNSLYISNPSKIDYSDSWISQRSIDTGNPNISASDLFWFVGTKYYRVAYPEPLAKALELKPWGEE